MPVLDLNAPQFGYSWVPAEDPTGNGHPSWELVHRAEDGTIRRSRKFAQVHNTAGYREVDMSDPADTSNVFERDGSGRIVVA